MTEGLHYDAPPTIAAFCQSNSFGRIIAGPIGSGKTTGIIMELLRRSAEQAQAVDGLRYTRFALCRQTLQQLKATVLKDPAIGSPSWRQCRRQPNPPRRS